MTAADLARRLRARDIGAGEALAAHLARVDRLNPALGAVVSVDVDRAHARAAEADRALSRGDVWGPLHGVPMTLKDAHDVAGLRTTVGTAELDRIADEDGTVAARLRAAGAIVFGHTNVPPWLADYQSANPIFGRTSNPWDVARTAGGSSGGAAAAVAAGLTPVEVGSDLNGSVRQPAHFCGVYGLKTTEHRVPMTGFFRVPGAPRSVRVMSTLGPLARDLGDIELVLSIIAGPDGRDGDVPPVPLAARPIPATGELRLAFASALPGARVAAELRRRVEEVAARAVRAGARVDERLPAYDAAAAGALFGALVETIVGVLDPRAELADERRTLAWYLAALERRDGIIAAWEAYFDGVDALLLPAGMTAAFGHRDTGAPIVVDGRDESYWGQSAMLGIFNLLGVPVLTVPAGAGADGLPIGIQIVGRRWSEPRLVAIARALEDAGVLPGFRPPPDDQPSSVNDP
jgi:amidase